MINTYMTNKNHSSDLENYLNKLSLAAPWHRSFTEHERIVIILITCTFISLAGCILLCLLFSRSPLRRRYYSIKKPGMR